MKTNIKTNLTIIITSVLSGLLTLPITLGIITDQYALLLIVIPLGIIIVYAFKYFKKLIGEYKDERR